MTDSLSNQTPKNSFGDLLHVSNGNAGVDDTLRTVFDGIGNATALQISTTGLKVLGDIEVTGSVVGQNTFDDLPPESVAAVSSPGDSLSASRSDHVHAHGDQAGGSLHAVATTSVAGFMSSSDKSKLDGVASGATANATDAQLRDRSTHTGTQAISTVAGLQSALDAKLATNGDGSNVVVTATGATTARALKDKLSDEMNLLDFGAKGDGATDDTAAVTAALATGKPVYAPPGTYIVNGVVIPSSAKLRGARYGDTIFKLKAGGSRCFVTAGADALFGTGGTGGVNSVRLSDFRIDGNKDNAPGGEGIVAYWYASSMSRVIVRNCAGRGIREEWGDYGTPEPTVRMENAYTDVSVVECGGAAGWYHNGPHDSRFYGCQTVMCTGFAGIHVGPRATGAMFTACHPWGYVQAGILPQWAVVFDAPGCMWIGSTAEGGSIGQILIRASDCQVIGGHQYNIVPGSPFKGIQIGDSANGFTNIAGTYVKTKLTNYPSGFVVFNSDGGYSDIDVIGYAADSPSTLYSGTPAATSNVSLRIGGPGGGSYSHEVRRRSFLDGTDVGAGFTGQFPNPALTVAETMHATSKRAVVQIGSNYQLMQDTGASGTKDLGLYQVNVAGFVSAWRYTDGLQWTRAVAPLTTALYDIGATTFRYGTVYAANADLTGTIKAGATTIVDANSHLGLRSYTVATLPSASTAARLINVSDGTSNKRLAISDGTNWCWPDGAIVS